MYEALPFWHGLLTGLGFSVRVPQAAGVSSAAGVSDVSSAAGLSGVGTGVGAVGGSRAAWETVPSESVCYPAKLTHGRLFALLEKDCDAVFMARFERSYHCPVTCGYADALADGAGLGTRDGMPGLIAPTLSRSKPRSIAASAEDRAMLAACLEPLASAAGAPLEDGEVERALTAALAAQEAFEEAMERAGDEAMRWVEADPRRHAILVTGRPYHNDAALAHDVDVMLRRMGFAVLNPLSLGRRLREVDGHAPGTQPWKPAKRLVRSARFAIGHPQVDLVCLQSFGCGFDAVSLEEVRDILTGAGAPFTALKVDEMVDTAHLRIRLRTLGETIAARKRRATADARTNVSRETFTSAATEAGAELTDDVGEAPAEAGAPAQVRAESPSPAEAETGAFLLEQPLDEGDLEVARRCTAKDVCFTATALAARAIRMLEADPNLEALVLPEACERCLVDAVPRMVERATGRTPEFVWERTWRSKNVPDTAGGSSALASPTAGAEAAVSTGGAERPRVGIVGNPLLVFDPFMNDGLVALLEALGAEPVLPDADLLFSDDVRFLPQLDAFAAAGVRHVIYLQSFGCLKGHVRSRGALHELGRRYPSLQVTVLDYDPEASALNRENRVRLVVEAARRGLQ